MKRATIFIILPALIFIGSVTTAALAGSSQSYTIGVHIPAIAGVNVPLDDPSAEIRPSNLMQGLQMDVRQVLRGNEPVILQTVLVR
jgi:hypothetical protein